MTNVLKKIEIERAHIAALQGQLSNPAQAHLSRAELRSALAVQVDAWHEHAVERIAAGLRLAAGGGDLEGLLLPEAHGFALEPSVAAHEHPIDARAWLTFAIGKKEMLARFKPLLDEMPEGLDAATREQHIADVQRQIVEAEVREEALLREAEREGLDWDPRPGQRPEAAILIGYGS